jgi:hypothetical protein
MSASGEDAEPGVYLKDPDGRWRRIHDDRGGDYHLHDLRELFGLGVRGQDEAGLPLLALDRTQARRLPALARSAEAALDPGLLALIAELSEAAATLPARVRTLQLMQVF